MRHVIRLTLVAAILLGGAAPARAEDARIWRLGVLAPGRIPLDAIHTVTLPELAKSGFTEGSNLVLDLRTGGVDDLPGIAREMSAARPDVVFAVGGAAIRAGRDAMKLTPIVGAFIGEDPMAAGFGLSLARPGGTITGVVMLAPELGAKRLDLLHAALPQAVRIAALAVEPARDEPNIAAMVDAAAGLGIDLQVFYAATAADYPATFAKMRVLGMQALAIVSAPELASNAEGLASLALKGGLPTICEWSWMAEQGCLIGDGPDFAELHRRTADYVVRIFHGARPADLPMESPVRFKTSINMTTAKSLGIKLPADVLIRADEIIE
jgi:putative ABC transport system substrate-binding protein